MAAAGAILLAAGQSARFGSDKRQAVGDWQEPLLHHVLRLYRPCFPCLGVVIGSGDAFGQAACREFSATPLVNEEADLGMGRSLAVGIAWAMRQELVCAVIGLADMPWVSVDIIRDVAAQGLLSGRLVVPRCDGQLGFPRAIPSSCFADLLALRGDRGASAVLDWQGAAWLECADPGVLRDVDRPADLAWRPSDSP